MFLFLFLLVAGLGDLCLGGATQVQAQGVLELAFGQAAQESQVPVPLLKALCYMEGRLSNHDGTASMDGGYGCMHLRLDAHSTTLMRAAQLLHARPSLLRSNMQWNIRGGAAVLADSERQLLRRPSQDLALDDWYPVIAAYSGASTPAMARLYADALFTLLQHGFQADAEDGERIVLEPQKLHYPVTTLSSLPASITVLSAGVQRPRVGMHSVDVPESQPPAMVQRSLPGHLSRPAQSQHVARQHTNLPSGCVDDHHTDYPLAVNCILDAHRYDCKTVKGNAPCTYERAQRPTAALPIEFVVIHDIEGSAQAALSSFRNPSSSDSSHYIVDSNGTVYQVVRESDIAYHAGNYWYNQRSIGIEHAGYDATGYRWYNATLYLASASLTAYLLTKYHIPLDHDHILSHGTVPAPSLALGPNHVDPGPYWMWDRYFQLIANLGVPYAPVSDNSTVFMLRPKTSLAPLGGNSETQGNYNFFPLYNGPSTDSGLVPGVGGNDPTDETSNIEPGVSYVATNAVLDPAGSGKMLYQIWYGVEARPSGHSGSVLAIARQVWLAATPDMVVRGHGLALRLSHLTSLYGRPNLNTSYRIGVAAGGAVFASPFAIISDNHVWYAINYNHRQAWLPVDA